MRANRINRGGSLRRQSRIRGAVPCHVHDRSQPPFQSYARHEAVRDISFSVARGEIVGFLGPNGAGKTTTLRMLTGYLPPTSGSAKVAGFDVFHQSIEARRKIGYMPENVPLYGEMRVRSISATGPN